MYRETIKTFFTCFILTNLIGYLFIIQSNLLKYIGNLKSKFEIVIFVNKKEETPKVIEEKIRRITTVESVKFISKEEIRQKMSKFEKEMMLTDQKNPFPDTFSVQVAEIRQDIISNLRSQLEKISNIDEINYDKNLLKIIQGALNFFKITNYILIMAFSSVFIVFIVSIILGHQVINMEFVKNKMLYLHLFTGLLGSLISVVALSILTSFVLKNNIEQYSNLNLQHVLILFLCAFFVVLIRTVSQYRTISKISFR